MKVGKPSVRAVRKRVMNLVYAEFEFALLEQALRDVLAEARWLRNYGLASGGANESEFYALDFALKAFDAATKSKKKGEVK